MSRKPQSNAGDEGEIRNARDREKLIAQREADDLAFLLASPQGRRYIWRQIGQCGVFKTSFTGNSTTFFNEGARNIGLQMLAEIDPDALALMMKEARNDELAQHSA